MLNQRNDGCHAMVCFSAAHDTALQKLMAAGLPSFFLNPNLSSRQVFATHFQSDDLQLNVFFTVSFTRYHLYILSVYVMSFRSMTPEND